MGKKQRVLCMLQFVILSCLFIALATNDNGSTPNGSVTSIDTQTDILDLPATSGQSTSWYLSQIQAPGAWPIVSGGQNVVVALLDTGVDDKHQCLQNKVIGWTSFTNAKEFDANCIHGTFVAGIIAGKNDKNRIMGLAYSSLLLDVKVVKKDGNTDAGKVAQGIIWAANHGANIINVSIVINQPYQPLENAVDYAWEKGCVIIAAAGNNASNDPVYPAFYRHVIAVAAIDRTGCLASWSNMGNWISVAAPGVDIYSTLPGNRFGYKSGTSFSTALVSGEAALLFNKARDVNNNGRVNDEVFDTILNNCCSPSGLSVPIKVIDVNKAAKSIINESEH
jgi:subtilisin family serine protease